MKRLIITLLLLFAGAVVALPGAVGVVAERQHQQITRQINAAGDQLTEESYERGWFSTNTRYRYRIEDERLRKLAAMITAEPAGTPELIVTSRIVHGPMPVIAGGGDVLAWTDMDSTLVLRSPSGVDTELPGELQSRIKPDGSSEFRYHAKAETRPVRDGLTLSWGDTDVVVGLARTMDRLSVDGEVGPIKLTDATATAELGPAVITARQDKRRSGVWTGETSLRLDDVALPGFSAADLLFESSVRESNLQLSYDVKVQADELQGEGLDDKSLRIDFFGQRLDEAALGNLLGLLALYPDPGQIPAARRDELVGRILAGGPELTVRALKIPTIDADIEGDGFVTVKPGTGITLSELSRGAEGNATLLLPQTLVAQFKAQATPDMQAAIDVMMRLRVLKPQGNRYLVEASYANKLLTVNGFPVPIPNF